MCGTDGEYRSRTEFYGQLQIGNAPWEVDEQSPARHSVRRDAGGWSYLASGNREVFEMIGKVLKTLGLLAALGLAAAASPVIGAGEWSAWPTVNNDGVPL